MNKRTRRFPYLLPIFLSFYVMGFIDLIGVFSGYVKKDFGLSDSMAQLLPGVVFIWFALVPIPAGIFQDRKGKRLTVNLGLIITTLGLLVPFVYYSSITAILGFMILGIGNTILQVSANPLLFNISAKGNKAANLSLSHLIKAIAAISGPAITAALAGFAGNWRLVFPVYAGLSLIAAAWLFLMNTKESKFVKPPATFGGILSLLRKKFVAIMIVATFLVTGFNAGLNANISGFLLHRFAIPIESANQGISILVASLAIGLLVGSLVLRKIRPVNFLYGSVLVTLLGLTGIMVTREINLARIMIFVAGIGFSNIFPVLFAMIVERMPEYDNELSALIILSMTGGAIIPPVMGLITNYAGVTTSMLVPAACILYVFIATYYAVNTENEGTTT